METFHKANTASEIAAINGILRNILKRWEARREEEVPDRTVIIPPIERDGEPPCAVSSEPEKEEGPVPLPPEVPEFFTETVIISPMETAGPAASSAPSAGELPREEETAHVHEAEEELLEKTAFLRPTYPEGAAVIPESRPEDMLEKTVMIRTDAGAGAVPEAGGGVAEQKTGEDAEGLEKTVIIKPDMSRGPRGNGTRR